MTDRSENLTDGRGERQFVRMSAPMSLGIFSVLAIGLADAYFLARAGDAALAAAGFVYPVIVAVTAFSVGLSAGANAALSRARGGARTAARTTVSSWLSRLARHRTGLAVMSAAESTVVPIPLETVIAPLMVGHSGKALTIVLWVWLGCLAGASLFFLVGHWALEPVVIPTLEALGLTEDLEEMTDELARQGFFWTIFAVSFSPVPMQLATLGAGAAGGNYLVFLAAIALSRGLRYFGLALFAQIIGPRITAMRLPKRYAIPGMMLALTAIWGISQLI